MQVTAEIRDKFSITRGYFTLEQMSMLKPIHSATLLKRDKANAHTRKEPAPQSQTPPAPPAASVKATATTIHPPPPANTKQKATKRQRKAA